MADEEQPTNPPHLRAFTPRPLPERVAGDLSSEEHRRLVRAGLDYPSMRQAMEQANREWLDEQEPPTTNGYDATVNAVNMADVEQRPVDWLWFPWMAYGKLAVLDGDPSLGKSTLALTFAACVSTGLRFPNEEASLIARPPAHVVVLSAEDGAGDTIKPRLIEAKADLHNVSLVQSIQVKVDEETTTTRMPHLPEDIGALAALVRKLQARLVIVDVLAAYTGGRGMNSHADADIRTILAPLSAMAEETHSVVLALRHLNKTSSESNAMYRGGGSIAIVGAARHAFVVAQHPEDDQRRVFACVKNNLAPRPPAFAYSIERGETYDTARVVFHNGPVNVTLEQMMRGKKEDRQYANAPTKKSIAAEFIADLLQDGPRPATELVALGELLDPPIDKSTLYRARKEVGVFSITEATEDGSHRNLWSLPTDED